MRSLWQHRWAPYCSHRVISTSTAVDSQIAHKIPYLEYPLCTGNGMMFYKEMQQSAPGVVDDLHIWHNEGGRNLWQHLQVPCGSNHTISVEFDSQIAYKMPEFGCTLRMGNGMLCYKERYLLLMKWFITFPWCIRKVTGFSDSIPKSLMVQTMPFCLRLTLTLCTKYQILGTLSE